MLIMVKADYVHLRDAVGPVCLVKPQIFVFKQQQVFLVPFNVFLCCRLPNLLRFVAEIGAEALENCAFQETTSCDHVFVS